MVKFQSLTLTPNWSLFELKSSGGYITLKVKLES